MDELGAVTLAATLEELQRDGVLQRYGEKYETTRRWRAARHRALMTHEAPSARIVASNPILQALIAFYGKRRAIDTLTPHVAVLFALEAKPAS